MSDAVARRAFAARRIHESAETARRLLARPVLDSVAEIAAALVTVLRAGGTVLFFGNGGSAAEATHFAAELVGRFYTDRAPLSALCLTDNTSSLTAIANDYSYEVALARQVEGLGRPGDFAVALTTSGNSPNIVSALEAAHRGGLVTAALTGATGGRVREVADLCLCVPSTDTPRIQEAHMLLGHIACEIVERELFGEAGGEDAAGGTVAWP